jgi:hypothetical protein
MTHFPMTKAVLFPVVAVAMALDPILGAADCDLVKVLVSQGGLAMTLLLLMYYTRRDARERERELRERVIEKERENTQRVAESGQRHAENLERLNTLAAIAADSARAASENAAATRELTRAIDRLASERGR